MYYVYLLKSDKDEKFYIGRTDNLRQRFEDHTKGRVIATRHRLPIRLMYYESYITKKLSIEREKQLKRFGSAYRSLINRLHT